MSVDIRPLTKNGHDWASRYPLILQAVRRLKVHACKMGLEGIVSKRLGSRYRSGRTSDWLKFKNPEAPAVRREAEEDWGKRRSSPCAASATILS